MTTPARATDIVFTRHGARRGLGWLAEAYAMFLRAWAPWLWLIALYYVLLLVAANLVPVVGQIAFPLLKPVFAVGLLAAAWTQERGGKPALSHLFQGFRANLRSLLLLGAALVLGITAAFAVSRLIDGGLLLGMLAGKEKLSETLLLDPRLQGALFVTTVAALPTILALWFAPALVVFQDTGPGAALGASLRAALANWRPIVVYTLAVLAFGLLVPSLVVRVAVTLAPTEFTVAILQLLLVIYGLMFAATLHISDYVSYRDIFHAGETLAPLGASATGRRG